MVAGSGVVGPAVDDGLLLHDPRHRSLGSRRGITPGADRLGNLADGRLDRPPHPGSAGLFSSPSAKLVDRSCGHGAGNGRRVGPASSQRRGHAAHGRRNLRLWTERSLAIRGVLLRAEFDQPGASIGVGAAGRDGFALYALSGRIAFDVEVVSEHGDLAAACVVSGLRPGGLGDPDKGAAGAPVLRRARSRSIA